MTEEIDKKIEIAVLAKDVQMHGRIISNLEKDIKDLKSYQTELGLIVNMYMERLNGFDVKLDNTSKNFEQKLNELMALINKVIYPDENKIKEQIHHNDLIIQHGNRLDHLESFQNRTESWVNGIIARASIFSHVGRNIKTYFFLLVFIGFIAYVILPNEIKDLFKWGVG